MNNIVPIWEKYTLTVEEAAEYFNNGEARIRNLVNENKTASYVMWKGTRPHIKRIKFEHYIDSINVI